MGKPELFSSISGLGSRGVERTGLLVWETGSVQPLCCLWALNQPLCPSGWQPAWRAACPWESRENADTPARCRMGPPKIYLLAPPPAPHSASALARTVLTGQGSHPSSLCVSS